MAKPGHIYHWKHGWIPITPRAAMVKAKGRRSLADRYMREHHIEDKRAGGDRRDGGGYPAHIQKALDEGRISKRRADAMVGNRRSHEHRGTFEYKPGTKTRDYPDRPSGSSQAPSGGPKSADEARRMTRPELEPHAKAGNEHAQGELARRAARRGPGQHNRKPAAPAPAPRKAPEAPKVDNRNSKPLVPVEPHQPKVEKAPEVADETAAINDALPAGHTVSSLGSWDRHNVNGESIGRVQQHVSGGFVAYLTDSAPTKSHPFRVKRTYVGETYSNRLDAHKALADAHIKRTQDKAAKAAKAQAKSAKITGVAGPNGTTWVPHTLESDGTRAGAEAALKAKASFRAGGHEVTIESAMSEAQTRELLANISRAVERSSPNLGGANVKFLVPSGDPHFRSTRKITGAYVHVGGTTVHINPKVADGTHAEAFRNAGHSGHFMPAGKSHPLEYTLVHELGHVADNVNGHTRNPDTRTPSGFSIPMGDRDHAHSLHREHYMDGSKYSRENVAEGYAEAFAQYHIGGPGSHKAADAYAAHYGWATPKHVERPADGRGLEDEAAWNRAVNESTRRALDPEGRYADTPKAPARTPEQMKRAMDDFDRQFRLGKYAPANRQSVGGASSPFDAGHSAGLAKADAARTKPLSSTVRGVKEDLGTLPADVRARLLKGRSVDSMTSEELSALRKAVMAYHIRQRKG